MTTGASRPAPTLAVVIVNYFKAERLLDCVRSLAGQIGAQATEIAVVENSADRRQHGVLEAAARRGEFVLVEPHANVGYTRGCNLGVRALPRTDFVVLCNPDIVWDQPDSLERLIGIAQADPGIGVLAPLQVDDDGALVETARMFPTLLHQVKRRLLPRDCSELHLIQPLARGSADLIDVDWLQSSCVLVRRSLWDRLGGLDERYFLFMSDVELGRATWARGLRVCITAKVKVRADGKRASAGGFGALLTSRTQRNHLRDALRYYMANGIRMGRRRPYPDATLQGMVPTSE